MTKTAKPKLMSESTFQEELLKAFEHDDDIKIFRHNVGGMTGASGKYVQFGKKGQSDIYGIVREYRCPFCNRNVTSRVASVNYTRTVNLASDHDATKEGRTLS